MFNNLYILHYFLILEIIINIIVIFIVTIMHYVNQIITFTWNFFFRFNLLLALIIFSYMSVIGNYKTSIRNNLLSRHLLV